MWMQLRAQNGEIAAETGVTIKVSGSHHIGPHQTSDQHETVDQVLQLRHFNCSNLEQILTFISLDCQFAKLPLGLVFLLIVILSWLQA